MSETKASTNRFEPKIIAYVCNWCTYLGADLAGTTRLEYPPNVRIIRLPCTGRIDFNLIVKGFEVGADAVLISGCHPGDCHYLSGNIKAMRRAGLLRKLLTELGVEAPRFRLEWIAASEPHRYVSVVNEMIEEVRSLGTRTKE